MGAILSQRTDAWRVGYQTGSKDEMSQSLPTLVSPTFTLLSGERAVGILSALVKKSG
jgi:hypothetical protein